MGYAYAGAHGSREAHRWPGAVLVYVHGAAYRSAAHWLLAGRAIGAHIGS